jgi:murein DD-endopeptidase MepM/ murein hydrolase activator NlpD
MLRSGTFLARAAALALGVTLFAACAGTPGAVGTADATPPTPAATATATRAATVRPSATATPVAAATRTATPRPTASPTASATPGPRVHEVAEGETLSGIAVQYGISSATLLQANGLTDADALRPGQELVIPAVDLPAGAGADTQSLVICPANGAARHLDLPTEPIVLLIAGDNAFLLAGGDLYSLQVADLASASALSPSNEMPPGRKVGGYTIQELVDLAVDPANGDLYLLDKSNDVYRRTAEGDWSLALSAGTVPGYYMDPQFLAIQAAAGSLYLLDADGAVIWQANAATPETPPTEWWLGDALASGMDLAILPDGSPAVLTREGRLWTYPAGEPSEALRLPSAGTASWPAQVTASSDGTLYVADGQSRTVYSLTADGQISAAIRLAFSDMRRLRSVAVQNGHLYALAGNTLYSGDLAAAATVETGNVCADVTYDDGYYFYGVDLTAALAGVEMPFPGASLPQRPRSFPGARRLYRFGVHEGVDLYPGDVADLTFGSPVAAIGPGTVSRIDSDFVEMTPDEYSVVMGRTESEHRTPPDVLDQLRGRQVWVTHSPGVESHYCHLQSVSDDLAVGSAVKAGDLVGTVGASGTSSGVYGEASGEHLHWEIWIDGHYLGEGLSIYETMRLWEAIFTP